MEEDIKKTGQILVNTGDGKGKTTAAFGTAMRALGWKKKVAMIQFVKGKWITGERRYAESIEGLDFYVMGKGFTWESEDLSIDKKAAIAAWEKAEEILTSDKYHLLVLDEITYICHFGFVPVDRIVEGLKNRSPKLSVIVTGRDCPKEILEIADLISEIKCVKHPYQSGKKALKGIDF